MLTLHQDSNKGISVGKAFPKPDNMRLQNSYGGRNDSHTLSSDLHTHAMALYPQNKM